MFPCGLLWWFPEVAFQVHARLENGDAFACEEFSLQGSVRLADKDLAALTDDAMPGNAFSGGCRGHGPAGAARATGQAQGSRECPIS